MIEDNFEKNKEILQLLFDLNEKTIAAIRADIIKRKMTSSFLSRLSVNPLFVWLISFFERLIAPRMSRNFDFAGDSFVFVSCIDPVHRVKALPLIAKDFKYTLFFLPTVTRPTVVKTYYKYYKEKSHEKAYFGTFNWDDVVKYHKFIKQKADLINEIKSNCKNDTRVLKEYVLRFALYRIYAERVFSVARSDQLWLFEHDKFYYIPVINYFKRKGIMTTQWQHGTFFNPNSTTYFPLYSDKIICCSEREKELYKSNGVEDEDVYITGAPLQTIVKKNRKVPLKKYDLLVILTVTEPKELELQKEVLTYIKEELKDKKVLLRYRPRSAATDKVNLAVYAKGLMVSEGATLSEDICSSDRIITFSLDSIYEIIRNNKLFIVFVDSFDIKDPCLNGVCSTVDNAKNSIERLFTDNIDNNKERYVSIFGETEIQKIRANFKRVTNELNNCLKK